MEHISDVSFLYLLLLRFENWQDIQKKEKRQRNDCSNSTRNGDGGGGGGDGRYIKKLKVFFLLCHSKRMRNFLSFRNLIGGAFPPLARLPYRAAFIYTMIYRLQHRWQTHTVDTQTRLSINFAWQKTVMKMCGDLCVRLVGGSRLLCDFLFRFTPSIAIFRARGMALQLLYIRYDCVFFSFILSSSSSLSYRGWRFLLLLLLSFLV